MLTVEPPYYLVRGVTIFRDHADPDQFYYLPGVPQLTSFTLYKYRVSIAADGSDPTRAPGAGLALFDVEVPPPNLTLLATELSSQSGRENPRLVPVMPRTADVRAIIAKADGDKLFEDLFETHAAPLVPPFHSAFALALSAEAATLMEQAAMPRPGPDGAAAAAALPIGVVYELRFIALTPALHARVTMNYDEAYKRFSASVAFQYYYVKAGLDLDIAWLVEHDFIKIEIIQFSDAADAERQRTLVMQLVTARIQRDFFHSGLPAQDTAVPSGPLASLLGGGTSGTKVDSSTAMFVLKAKYEADVQSKDFVLTFDSRTAVELTHTMAGHLGSLVQGAQPQVLAIDTHDPFFSRLSVRLLSAIDFDALSDLRDAVVDVTFNDVRNSYAFGPTEGGPFTFAAAMPQPDKDEFSYSATYDFDVNQGKGPARIAAGPFATRSRVVVVDPALHFRSRRVTFSLGPIDPARVPRLHVRVRVPDEDPTAAPLALDTFVLDAANPSHVFRVHAALGPTPLRVRVRPSWEDAHGNIHDGDESEVTADATLLLGPYVDIVPLFVSPAVDWTQVSQVVIEVRYEDGDNVLDRTLTFTAADKNAGQRVDIPLLDASKRAYSWKQTVFKLDGTSTQTEFATADASVLAPASQKPTSAEVRVVWVGAAGDALGMRVDFWADTPSGDEQQVSAFLRAGVDGDTSVTLPLDRSGALVYRYKATKITAGGETLVRTASDQSSPMLIVQSA